jgi:hypothetical protein
MALIWIKDSFLAAALRYRGAGPYSRRSNCMRSRLAISSARR